MYMGWRHPRITGDEYDEFVDLFIQAVKRRWPNALLQFEDFAQQTATPLLQRYRDELCCFNDDIQGTAAVTVGTLLAACHAKNEQLKDQRITFVGAGSAGCGIAEQVIAQMKAEGLSDAEARLRVTVLNRYGLILDTMTTLLDFQKTLCQSPSFMDGWNIESDTASLLEVTEHFKPTVLVGVSGQPGLFNESVVKTMHKHCKKPIVMPLSNPTSRVEGLPQDILNWTDGDAIVSTGSPFTPVHLNGQNYPIAQCNNSYIFPGVGLGVIASKATRVTENMLMASSHALAESSPLVKNGEGELLPALNDIRDVSLSIAKAVFKQAIEDGVALSVPEEMIDERINANFWEPKYRNYKRVC